MNRFNYLRNAATAASFVCFAMASTMAHATILTAGATVSLFGTTYAANPALGGSVIADTSIPFQIIYNNQAINMVVQNRVVRESASGTLDFYVRVYTANVPVNFPQLNVLRTGFSKAGVPLWTDVNYRTDGTGVAAPQSATRQAASGDYIEFNMNNPTIGVQSNGTYFMMVRTQATSYTANGTFELIIGGYGAYALGGAYMPG